jgi:glycine hydroxymethyltransferase
MGCFEVSGPNAAFFLDAVATNYVQRVETGGSCYAFLLDPEGLPIDDLLIYRVERDRYLLVVNAANERKDWDWLMRVNRGEALIATNRPWVRIEAPAVLRNLKEPDSGEGQLRDLALQGPASLAILQACTGDARVRATLAHVRRTDLAQVELDGISVVAARTGYTGEEMGFELFVHPDQQVALWDRLLSVGSSYGIKPCGLAARDSTRIEAGLPLYGHELAGPLHIRPAEAGFAGYVRYHKPFFVGRDPSLKADLAQNRVIVRWRMSRRGVRRPGLADAVVDASGRITGFVTSCSIDTSGYLNGMAIVKGKGTRDGQVLGIFVSAGRRGQPMKAEWEIGDRVPVPVEAVVLSRFPEKRGRGEARSEE